MQYDVVKIYTAQDNLQAEMVLNILRDNDIPAYKKDLGNAGFMNLYSGNSRGGEDIFVAEVNAEKAAEVLESIGWEENL